MTEGHSSTLHRLLYTSKARFTCSEKHVPVEIEAIVTQAVKNNIARDLTGILLYIQGTFIQVLEGPLAGIETAFEAICGDLRHGGMKLIEMTAVEERVFADWSMAYVGFDDDPKRIRVNRDLQEIYVTIENDPDKALRQMRGLVGLKTENISP